MACIHLATGSCGYPAADVAADEVLLALAEQAGPTFEAFRLWESPRHAVVLGHNSAVHAEVNQAACQAEGVAIVRRTSGGCSVVMGPGCLMYAVVLSVERQPALRFPEAAHLHVLGLLAAALAPCLPRIARKGTSDLAVDQIKCSGNSLRIKRSHLLYHGTLLYDFPLAAISRWLTMPPREPDYRQGREHQAFVGNVPVSVSELKARLLQAFAPQSVELQIPHIQVQAQVEDRFGRAEWTFRR